MKIFPRKNQVLVRPDKKDGNTTNFGIITPDNEEKEEKSIGTVEAVGPDINDIEVGKRVVFMAVAGESIFTKEDKGAKDPTYKLLLDEEVLAFIEE